MIIILNRFWNLLQEPQEPRHRPCENRARTLREAETVPKLQNHVFKRLDKVKARALAQIEWRIEQRK
jgi:hypothetical protein